MTPAAAAARGRWKRAAAEAEGGRRNPHEPDASPWLRRLLGPFYVTGSFWYRFHHFGVWVLPSPLVAWWVWMFTFFFWLALRRVRRAVASNLAVVLGPCGFVERERRVFRTLLSWAWCMSERYEQLSTTRRLRFAVEHAGLWDEAAASPRGFVFLTAHVSNWQVASMLPLAMKDATWSKRVHVVREIERHRGAQDFVQSLLAPLARERYVTHFAADSASLGIELLAALRDGDLVAMQGDRPRAGGQSVEIELFGRPFDLPVGPAVLARAAEVAIFPVFAFRTGRRCYRVVLRPPIHVPRTADRDADVRHGMQEVARHVEWAIREAPEQWFLFHDVWAESRGMQTAEGV